MGFVTKAPLWLTMVNALLAWWPSTTLVMTHHQMFARPPLPKELEKNI
jgi:hypothetical protein